MSCRAPRMCFLLLAEIICFLVAREALYYLEPNSIIHNGLAYWCVSLPLRATIPTLSGLTGMWRLALCRSKGTNSFIDSLRLRYSLVTGDTKSCNEWCESIPPSSGGVNCNFSPVVFTTVQRCFRRPKNWIHNIQYNNCVIGQQKQAKQTPRNDHFSNCTSYILRFINIITMKFLPKLQNLIQKLWAQASNPYKSQDVYHFMIMRTLCLDWNGW